jgi:hypothetical protein
VSASTWPLEAPFGAASARLVLAGEIRHDELFFKDDGSPIRSLHDGIIHRRVFRGTWRASPGSTASAQVRKRPRQIIDARDVEQHAIAREKAPRSRTGDAAQTRGVIGASADADLQQIETT